MNDVIAAVGHGTRGYKGNRMSNYRRVPRTDWILEELTEGGWFVCHPKADSGLRVSSPIVDTDADEVDPCPEPSDALIDGLEDGMHALAKLKKDDADFGGLDRVPTQVYVAWWQKRGAAIAQKVDGTLDWKTLGSYSESIHKKLEDR